MRQIHYGAAAGTGSRHDFKGKTHSLILVTEPASGGKSSSNSEIVRPSSGCLQFGAISARGASTKRRSCIAGCGKVSAGSSSTKSPAGSQRLLRLQSTKSRSSGGGP